MATAKLSKTTYNTFPLTWKASKFTKAARTITNPLARQPGQFYVKKVSDRLKELNDPSNTSWANVVKQYKKAGTVFDLNTRPEFDWVKIADILIDEDIQREMDVKHICDIARPGNFDVKRLSPIFAVKEIGKNVFHCTDGQHTLVVTAALAQAGLWNDVDPKKWDQVEVPVFYIETDDRSFAREYFAYINGKGKKKISAFDKHKQEVLSWRLDNNQSPEYKEAADRQTICELKNCIPLPESHEDSGLPGALTHVSGMRQQNLGTLKFIVYCHDKYWPGDVVDSGEYGFYGNLYESFEAEGISVKGKAFDQFLNDMNAIVKNLFINIEGLRQTAAETYTAYTTKVYANSKAQGDDTVALAIVMKIYEQLGGTHPLSSISMLHKQGKHDITDFLPLSIRKQIKELV